MVEDDEAVVAQVVRSLLLRSPWMPEPLLRSYAERALASFADATVRAYLPILVGRMVSALITSEPQQVMELSAAAS